MRVRVVSRAVRGPEGLSDLSRLNRRLGRCRSSLYRSGDRDSPTYMPNSWRRSRGCQRVLTSRVLNATPSLPETSKTYPLVKCAHPAHRWRPGSPRPGWIQILKDFLHAGEQTLIPMSNARSISFGLCQQHIRDASVRKGRSREQRICSRDRFELPSMVDEPSMVRCVRHVRGCLDVTGLQVSDSIGQPFSASSTNAKE